MASAPPLDPTGVSRSVIQFIEQCRYRSPIPEHPVASVERKAGCGYPENAPPAGAVFETILMAGCDDNKFVTKISQESHFPVDVRSNPTSCRAVVLIDINDPHLNRHEQVF